MEALEIIKKRFPEVVLIIGLQVGFYLLYYQIVEAAIRMAGSAEKQVVGSLPVGMDFLYGMGFVIVWIVGQMLFLGFLRTAFTDGARQQEPKTLLVTGKMFFWRMFRFQIVLEIALGGIAYICFTLIVATMFKDVEVANLPVWLEPVCAFAGMAVLAKPMLLCPAVMIAEDCLVKESFDRMKKLSLLSCSKLVKMFIGLIATRFVFAMIIGLTKAGAGGHYIIVAVQAVITSSLWLLVLLYAIQFVAVKNSFTAENAEIAEGEDAENI